MARQLGLGLINDINVITEINRNVDTIKKK